jgi:hypothetical protein
VKLPVTIRNTPLEIPSAAEQVCIEGISRKTGRRRKCSLRLKKWTTA